MMRKNTMLHLKRRGGTKPKKPRNIMLVSKRNGVGRLMKRRGNTSRLMRAGETSLERIPRNGCDRKRSTKGCLKRIGAKQAPAALRMTLLVLCPRNKAIETENVYVARLGIPIQDSTIIAVIEMNQ